MKAVHSLAFLTLGASAATAGGIDRTALDYGILFEQGRVLQFSVQQANPDISGTYSNDTPTGNMAQSFSGLSLGFKNDLGDRLSYAVLIGQPVGADARYPLGGYTGLEAHWSTEEVAALVQYRLGTSGSVFGGLRYLNTAANIAIPGFGYTATTTNDAKIGYVLGASYERRELAQRLALTYVSGVDTKLPTTETLGAGSMSSITTITLPQSLTLEGQTGISENMLVFGSVRWAEWSKWHVRPKGFVAETGEEITGFDHDFVTYTLGVGRKISDQLSVFGALGYESPVGGVSSILAPTDGMQSATLGAVWSRDQMKVTAAMQYQQLGDTFDRNDTRFSGNHLLGLGIKLGYSF